MRLLDLYCKAGGASVGYKEAGFTVTGIDKVPQPNYPYEFIQMDVLDVNPMWIRQNFDAVAGSPPCQANSVLRHRTGKDYVDLIPQTRELLIATGLPYVIENVVGASLKNPIKLCGTQFEGLRVIRHRLFETNWNLKAPAEHPRHPLVYTLDKRKNHYGLLDEWEDFVQVTGGGNCTLAAASDAMGIDWMTKAEINEAIPPAYTRYIGQQLSNHIRNNR